jgi:hypothetical protein
LSSKTELLLGVLVPVATFVVAILALAGLVTAVRQSSLVCVLVFIVAMVLVGVVLVIARDDHRRWVRYRDGLCCCCSASVI